MVTIGQLACTQLQRVEELLGRALGTKLTALVCNRDPREIKTHRRAQSAGAQSARGGKRAESFARRCFTLPTGATGCGPSRGQGGRLSVRVRLADTRPVSRSATLPTPISATRMLAEVLVRRVLAGSPAREDHLIAGNFGAETAGASGRAECLNAHWFLTLADAAEKLEYWRRYYNEERPHGAIGHKAPITLLNPGGASQPTVVTKPGNSTLGRSSKW